MVNHFFMNAINDFIKCLTHLGWVLHIYALENLVNIGSGNGLSPTWCQVIVSNNGLLLIRPLGTTLSEIWWKYKSLHTRKWIWKLENGRFYFIYIKYKFNVSSTGEPILCLAPSCFIQCRVTFVPHFSKGKWRRLYDSLWLSLLFFLLSFLASICPSVHPSANCGRSHCTTAGLICSISSCMKLSWSINVQQYVHWSNRAIWKLLSRIQIF